MKVHDDSEEGKVHVNFSCAGKKKSDLEMKQEM